jgi:LacI family transcriptional regulator
VRSTGEGAQAPSEPAPGGVTLYDVASLAGVSTATVSRVVHGMDRVRDSTRARVLEVIEQLGYVPDGAAQSLSRRRKDVIGLVGVQHTSAPKQQYDIESMSLLFYDEILRGVEAKIRHQSWSLLITYLEEDSGADLPRLLSLSGKVDGLLVGEGIVPAPFIARLANRLPVVVVAGNPRERAADVVTADNRAGSIALVTHLIDVHGRRRLHYVDGPATAPDAMERRRGLTQVLRSYPGCELTGASRSPAARKPGSRSWPVPTSPARSSAPMIRWPSASCRPSPRPASGYQMTWPSSASTTSSPVACSTPR